jgi:hypothetical protein
MKNLKKQLIILLLLASNVLIGQIDSTYLFHDIDRIHRQKTGMQVLGAWSIANIISGIALGNSAKGEDFYFYQMNAAWNVTNLGISTLGYLGIVKENPNFIAMEVHKKQLKLEKSLLFNSGLDLSYIFGGLWLLERANNFNSQKDYDRFRGFGRSIILQGSFLFLFDLSFYFIESYHANKLREIMNLFYLRKGQLGMNITF